MSSGATIPYQLRPNKAVDRELFLALLVRLGSAVDLRKFKYVGLGGPFLADFRLLHARTGITNMDCIEMEEDAHLRQEFNKPFPSIICLHKTLDEYLSETEFTQPVILWMDYTQPKDLPAQIESFAQQFLALPLGSVLRLTVNASPSSLGEPKDKNENVREWRLKKFKERMPEYHSASIVSDDMSPQRYGQCVLRAVQLAVDKRMLEAKDREVCWALATTYADGQGMATATLLILKRQDREVNAETPSSGRPQAPVQAAEPVETATSMETAKPVAVAEPGTPLTQGEASLPGEAAKRVPWPKAGDPGLRDLIRGWEFFSEPAAPLVLDMPNLSTLERLTMEAHDDPRSRMDFDLPRSEIGQDPILAFKKFYRVFPHFTRVEL